jgi:hypothetical protein
LSFLPNRTLLFSDAQKDSTMLYMASGLSNSTKVIDVVPFGKQNKGQVHTYGLAITDTLVFESNQDGDDTITYHDIIGNVLGTFWKANNGDKAHVRGIAYSPSDGEQGSLWICLNDEDQVVVLDLATRSVTYTLKVHKPNSIHAVGDLMFVSTESDDTPQPTVPAPTPAPSSSSALDHASSRNHQEANLGHHRHSLKPGSVQVFGKNGTATQYSFLTYLTDPKNLSHPCGLTSSPGGHSLYVMYQDPPAVLGWNITSACPPCSFHHTVLTYLDKDLIPEAVVYFDGVI